MNIYIKRMIVSSLGAIGGALLVLLIMFGPGWMTTTQKQKPTIHAKKYRFGEMCPDGLRVEYVNTVRLPKSVVCQKEVGGE